MLPLASVDDGLGKLLDVAGADCDAVGRRRHGVGRDESGAVALQVVLVVLHLVDALPARGALEPGLLKWDITERLQ